MATTTKGLLRYPLSTAAPNINQDIQNLASDADGQVVPRFTSIANRNTRFTAPVTNDAAIVNGRLHTYYSSAWHWDAFGEKNGTTDAGGNLITAHGLGATPTGIVIGSAQQATDLLNRILTFNWTGKDATNFTIYVHRTDTSAAVASTQVEVSWHAFV